MERIWNDINDEMKEGIYQHFVEEWGAVHGQQVVVEARLVHHLIYFHVLELFILVFMIRLTLTSCISLILFK